MVKGVPIDAVSHIMKDVRVTTNADNDTCTLILPNGSNPVLLGGDTAVFNGKTYLWNAGVLQVIDFDGISKEYSRCETCQTKIQCGRKHCTKHTPRVFRDTNGTKELGRAFGKLTYNPVFYAGKSLKQLEDSLKPGYRDARYDRWKTKKSSVGDLFYLGGMVCSRLLRSRLCQENESTSCRNRLNTPLVEFTDTEMDSVRHSI